MFFGSAIFEVTGLYTVKTNKLVKENIYEIRFQICPFFDKLPVTSIRFRSIAISQLLWDCTDLLT